MSAIQDQIAAGERHPNGTPKTIHHYGSDGKPVYHHQVVPMDKDELLALGHSAAEADKMIAEAKGKAASAA